MNSDDARRLLDALNRRPELVPAVLPVLREAFPEVYWTTSRGAASADATRFDHVSGRPS